MADDAPTRMLPPLDDINRAFWTGGSGGQLLIDRCPRCALWVSPPAADCPACDAALEAHAVSGSGTVFTYTVNHQPFNPAVPVPYVIAIVELDEQPGLRLATNIVDCEPDSVRIGMPVEVRFECHSAGGEPAYVPVFAPRRD
ncbi:Zn-ribbon domain-containing OB-fold protein [Mycobacterium sp. IDR2000157661]|uniref:Zn-ribbon domain-containing OB-fold protein n=1 Tax=Mycobacterium sp. IDR2000157661 TaxID=2867005 RepID=UPI001EEB4206|nr:OB-fold domain-containing protein [Mycobacterium sp. IDR2000157661]ULE33378.1 OB-fold domain-containing protein [Mycobacterium sp. IDR2000157661]